MYSDKDKKLLTDELWGIYYKPDIEGLGVQGGTSPYIVQKHFDKVNVDPYGFCLLYTSPSPRDVEESRMPSSA